MFDATGELQKLRGISECHSLDLTPPDIESLYVTKRTKALERLPELKRLKYLAAAELDVRQFEIICSAAQITHLEVNVLPFTSLAALEALRNLKVLSLYEGKKISSLVGIESLRDLEILSLANFGVSVSLDPISSCHKLRSLWLSGTTWTPMRVPSLNPLASLTRLERLMLPSVRVKDKKLSALHSLANLAEVKLPNFFPASEFVALAAAVPEARGKWLELHAGKA